MVFLICETCFTPTYYALRSMPIQAAPCGHVHGSDTKYVDG